MGTKKLFPNFLCPVRRMLPKGESETAGCGGAKFESCLHLDLHHIGKPVFSATRYSSSQQPPRCAILRNSKSADEMYRSDSAGNDADQLYRSNDLFMSRDINCGIDHEVD